MQIIFKIIIPLLKYYNLKCILYILIFYTMQNMNQNILLIPTQVLDTSRKSGYDWQALYD